MRAFVVLKMPPNAARQIERVVDSLKNTSELNTASRTKIRWMLPSQAHLTLHFLGEAGNHQIKTVIDNPGRELQSWGEPLKLRFGQGGAFPSPARARVLWLNLEGNASQLSVLASLAEGVARKSGLKQSNRKFHPHVTVARIQPAMNASGLLASLRPVRTTWHGQMVSLIRSDLTPPGAEHTALAQFDLSRVRVAK